MSHGVKSTSMVNKRHSDSIRDHITPNQLLTSSLNSNSMFHSNLKEVNATPKNANHLLHQLVSIC